MAALTIVALVLGTLGAWISGVNFYLSFVRYPLHQRLHRDKAFKWVSGFPLIGSSLLWIAAFLLWLSGRSQWVWAALLMSLLDTGGVIWFVAVLPWSGDRRR